MKNLPIIENRLLSALVKKNMTQTELSKSIGISKEYLSSLKKGKHAPNVSLLSLIAGVLGVLPEYLTGLINYSSMDEWTQQQSSITYKELYCIYEILKCDGLSPDLNELETAWKDNKSDYILNIKTLTGYTKKTTYGYLIQSYMTFKKLFSTSFID